MVIGLIVVFLIFAVVDMGLLTTNHKIKTMIIYFSLFLLGFAISLLLVVDKKPTSPSEIIERMVNYILVRCYFG